MSVWFRSITYGIEISILLSIIFIPVRVIAYMLSSKKGSPEKIVFDYLFFIYMCCVISVVFFPIPDIKDIIPGYRAQLVPGYCLYDTITKITFHKVFQILFNIVMTMPFGAYLGFCRKMNLKKVILFTLLFSATIEFGQLTGLFFTFEGSYRCCDVDDLVLNTLGGVLGLKLETYVVSSLKNITLPRRKKVYGYSHI